MEVAVASSQYLRQKEYEQCYILAGRVKYKSIRCLKHKEAEFGLCFILPP